METIKQILIRRDGYSEKKADDLIQDAVNDLQNRLFDPSYGDPEEVCTDHFGLEPDYLMELLNYI